MTPRGAVRVSPQPARVAAIVKLLVIGLDGGDRRIVEALDAPFLRGLIDRGVCPELTEDLWSRGWTEMLSGAPGQQTGALYAKPKLDGTHDFTAGFGTRAYPDLEGIEPLWRRLGRAGRSVGFMNIPTTMPAPEAPGFVVSGAGGGFNPSGGYPPEACHPAALHARLSAVDFDWETRLKASEVADTDALFDRIEHTVRRRCELFAELAVEHDPDVGFLVHKETVTLSNFAASELFALAARDGRPASGFQTRVARFFRTLDDALAELVERVTPEHVMVVADHGASELRYRVNPNALLEGAGLLVRAPAAAASLRGALYEAVRRTLPLPVKQAIARRYRANAEAAIRGLRETRDLVASKAFAARYVPGVYVNDRRFGGPVGDGADYERVVQAVLDAVAADPLAREHGLTARRYRGVQAGRDELFPDVWIDADETYFFDERGPFVDENRAVVREGPLDGVEADLHTGFKGRRPLVVLDPFTASLVRDDDANDLRAVYHWIVRVAEAT